MRACSTNGTITRELHDLPPHVWQFIKDNGFFGMIIPKKYGGLGFSALAHSEVVMKISSRSGTAAVSVMVPNSLGPSELLLQYGTEEQKDHYLPRLAKGWKYPVLRSPGRTRDRTRARFRIPALSAMANTTAKSMCWACVLPGRNATSPWGR